MRGRGRLALRPWNGKGEDRLPAKPMGQFPERLKNSKTRWSVHAQKRVCGCEFLGVAPLSKKDGVEAWNGGE